MKIVAPLAIAGALFAAGSAQSATNVYNVSVWYGAPNGVSSSTIADTAHTPTGAVSAQFTFTSNLANGGLDWEVPGPQNTTPDYNFFGDFLDNGTISNWSSPSGAFGDETSFLNASSTVAGDAFASFFKITGTYSSGAAYTGTITHDNGASLYDYLGNAVYSAPAESLAVTGAFSLPGGAHPFTLDYVSGNGAPSILIFSPSGGVPEPATWAMMLAGFGGMGALLRRRRAVAAVAA